MIISILLRDGVFVNPHDCAQADYDTDTGEVTISKTMSKRETITFPFSLLQSMLTSLSPFRKFEDQFSRLRQDGNKQE